MSNTELTHDALIQAIEEKMTELETNNCKAVAIATHDQFRQLINIKTLAECGVPIITIEDISTLLFMGTIGKTLYEPEHNIIGWLLRTMQAGR